MILSILRISKSQVKLCCVDNVAGLRWRFVNFRLPVVLKKTILTANLVIVGSGIFHVCCDNDFGFVHEDNELIFHLQVRHCSNVQAVSNYDYYYLTRSYPHL